MRSQTNKNTMNRNYKSDFDFIMRVKDCQGQEIGFPTFDWTAKIWTNNIANAYNVSCVGGDMVNCFNDNGQIHVVCDNHRLGTGKVNVEFHAMLPNEIYKDGKQDIYNVQDVDIELIKGNACAVTLEADVSIPVLQNVGCKAEKPIIVGRAIGRNAEVGDRYFNSAGVCLKCVFEEKQTCLVEQSVSAIFTIPENWPELYDKAIEIFKNGGDNLEIINILKPYTTLVEHLCSDTASPYVKILDGKLVVDKPVKMKTEHTNDSTKEDNIVRVVLAAGKRKGKEVILHNNMITCRFVYFWNGREGNLNIPRGRLNKTFKTFLKWKKPFYSDSRWSCKFRIYSGWRGKRSVNYKDVIVDKFCIKTIV